MGNSLKHCEGHLVLFTFAFMITLGVKHTLCLISIRAGKTKILFEVLHNER